MRKHQCSTELTRKAGQASRRLVGLPSGELLDWADTTTSGMGRAFSDYRQHGDPASLLEIRDHGLPALIALVDLLLTRNGETKS